MATIDSQPYSITPEGRPRRRFTPRDRQRLVRRFEKSGQSAVAFCRDNEVCASSLWRWLARRGREESSGGGGLVEIPMMAMQAQDLGAAAVRMELAGGTRLEIATGTDTAWLAALVRALLPASA
jgi:transposase-like protein